MVRNVLKDLEQQTSNTEDLQIKLEQMMAEKKAPQN